MPDLKLLGIALRARWHTSRSWASLPLNEDAVTVAFFNASIQMRLGDGEVLFFWSDPWLQEARLPDIAPDLTAVVVMRRRK
jgi:hypothetical protein